MDERIGWICDLLLGAAYADDHFHEREKAAILELMTTLVGDEAMAEQVRQRIEQFDASSFDPEATAAKFREDPLDKKLKILDLITAVHEADEEYSFDEDDYIRRIGLALDIAAEELEGFTLKYTVELLRDSLRQVTTIPPPLP